MRTNDGRWPGQLLAEAGMLAGPLADASDEAPDERIRLRWVPGEPLRATHVASGMCRCAGAPTATWTVGARTGLLTPMGFVGAWNSGLRNVEGRPLDLEVVPGEGLELPFAWWHPSGLPMAVRFDKGGGTFVRRVLYPAMSGAAAAAAFVHLGDVG